MRPQTHPTNKENIIDLVLLALTLVSVKLFYDVLVSDPLGILFLFLFIAVGILYTALLSISISLQRYETLNSRLKWNDRLDTIQFLLFLTLSILFWELFVQTLVGTETYKTSLNIDYQLFIRLALSVSYPSVMVVLMGFSKLLERKISDISLTISPEEFIIIRGKVDSTQMLFVYVYNDSKKILYDLKVQIDFPNDVFYWNNLTKGAAKNGLFTDSLDSLGPGSTKEYRIIPVYIGEGGRTGSLIRIRVHSELEKMEKIITADMREPSSSIEDAQST